MSLLLLNLVSETTQLLLVDLPVVLHLLLKGSLQNTKGAITGAVIRDLFPVRVGLLYLHIHYVLQPAHVLLLLVHHRQLMHLT